MAPWRVRSGWLPDRSAAGSGGRSIALAAIVALGFGASLAAFSAAYRTDHAFPEYAHRAAVTDLVVNPLFPTEEFANRLRELPHVRGLWTQDLLYAGVGEWRPMTAGEVATDNASGEGIGSVDGRYVEADRLMIDRGRAPTRAREVFVTESFRPRLDDLMGHRVEIGEQIPVAFLYPGDVDSDLNDNFDPDKIVEPIGTERLRVSGFGRLPDEVFDDDLFPRQRFVVSRDIAEKYSCSGSLLDASIEVIRAALFPPDCSRTYRYWAIDVDDRANVSTVAQGISDITDDLNARLPAALQEDPNGFRYFPILTTQSDLDARACSTQCSRPSSRSSCSASWPASRRCSWPCSRALAISVSLGRRTRRPSRWGCRNVHARLR